ncbi:MAG: chemotaxis protein CheC [Thermodesulfobacteriota bacterium]|nr:chemotaxis protein CheC [Thermodesulfobacteriota bacterium]
MNDNLHDPNKFFSEEEKDILQEIMNIAFGNATADLAELIDVQVILSIPDIRIMGFNLLPDFLNETINHGQRNSAIGQKFWGDFNGSGLLFLPSGTEQVLEKFLNVSYRDKISQKEDTELKAGLLIEISNILIGACVGKISGLLKTVVSYSPPELLNAEQGNYEFLLKHFEAEQTAIVMKTLFQFDQQDLNGLLLIMTNYESVGWMKKALHEFMEAYED